MPVLLTTPFNPGDLDSGHTYPRANIVSQEIRPEDAILQIRYEFGDMVNGKWVKGNASPDTVIVIMGAAYDELIAMPTNVQEDHKIYAGAKRVLYSYLIAHGYMEGVVE